MLSTQIITHKVIVKNTDGKGITKYPLTQDMYAIYRLAKADRKQGNMIWITDIDGNRLREVDPMKFEEFEEVQKDVSISNSNAVCEFGTRHPISGFPDNCTCAKDFDCLWFNLQDWLREQGYKINYASDIDSKMQQEFRNR